MTSDHEKPTAVLEPQRKPVPERLDDAAWGEEEVEKTGFRKWFTPILVTVISVAGVYSIGKKLVNSDGGGGRKETAVMVVQVVPPPPMAPTPPPPPPKEEVREDKQVEEKEEQAPEPEPQVTTAAAAKGPSGGITLAKGNGGGFFKKNTGNGISQAQKDFGVQVAKTIEDALRRHPIAKTAAGIAPKVRAAVSPDGRITGLVLESSTGNPTLDKIISEELTNLRTPSIAPDGTKFITVRISLRRPN